MSDTLDDAAKKLKTVNKTLTPKIRQHKTKGIVMDVAYFLFEETPNIRFSDRVDKIGY